jgi:hypothetical protein
MYKIGLIALANSHLASSGMPAALNEDIEDLAKAGFVVGVRERRLLRAGVLQAPQPWRAFGIEVQPFCLMRAVNAEGKPIDIDQIISKYLDQVSSNLPCRLLPSGLTPLALRLHNSILRTSVIMSEKCS